MSVKFVLTLLIPFLTPLALYAYQAGFYVPVFLGTCVFAGLSVLESDRIELICFFLAFFLALFGDPLSVLLGRWGYSQAGWYVHPTQALVIALGWGLVSWASWNLSKWVDLKTMLNITGSLFLISLFTGILLSNFFSWQSLAWAGLMSVLLYKLYTTSPEGEKLILLTSLSLGLIVEFSGVFLRVWWYSNPQYQSIISVISISLSYPLLIWSFSKIAGVLS